LKKVFLYLYPIKEYASIFLFHNDKLYDDLNIERPFDVLNECIQKRYRDKCYQVVYLLYPDKDIFGIIPKKEDKIIYTDILFSEHSAIDEAGNIKKDFIPKYPNEQLIISKLGDIDELVVGGYHAQDCVKRVAESALYLGIQTLIDLDMTDFFFNLYRQDNYFKVEQYSPQKYKEYIYSQAEKYGENFINRYFNETYSSVVYGFNKSNIARKK
jgi:hypothetical protein